MWCLPVRHGPETGWGSGTLHKQPKPALPQGAGGTFTRLPPSGPPASRGRRLEVRIPHVPPKLDRAMDVRALGTPHRRSERRARCFVEAEGRVLAVGRRQDPGPQLEPVAAISDP